jgi:crotonobetainyl-CoA:carnitine CoA-transferase CaiB-like acyl-CoA transferase
LESNGLDAEESCAKKPGLIPATVVLHGETGPWSNRPGFDEIGATVAGLFAAEGSLASPKQPPIKPICDNVVGWLGTVGVLAALRRRGVEGGSYKVVVSLTRTVLWQLSLGIFDKTYAQTVAGSTEELTNVRPGSVHRRNSAWYIPGPRRAGLPVQVTWIVSDRARSARIEQT